MFFFGVGVAPASPIIAVNVFAQHGQDPRIPAASSPIARPLAAVGRVVTKKLVSISENKAAPLAHASSTGFLVSPCYVLTTAHGVFGVPKQGSDPARDGLTEVTFISGQATGRGLSETSGVVVAQGEPFRIFERDWALVRLSRCEGRRLGWLSFHTSTEKPFSQVSAAGFPGDKDKTILWYQATCHLMRFDFQHFIWETDCATSPGSSGSPVFQMRGKSTLDVIALVVMDEHHTNGLLQKYSSEEANYALDVHFFLPKIQQYINDDIH